MKEKHLQKEELLEKLTEIYDQLEELEKTLDSNLSEHRKKLINDQSVKLAECENRISKLEKDCGLIHRMDKGRKANLRRSSNLKLELGF
jgi:hypothetical protein